MNTNLVLKYGTLAGIASAAYLLIFYFISPKLMLSGWVYWISWLLIFGFLYLAGRQKRETQKMELSLKDGLKTLFSVFIIADIIYYIFYYLLFNVFDPDLHLVVKDIRLGAFEQIKAQGIEKYGDASIDELIKKAEAQDYSISLAKLIVPFAYGVIAGFGASLLITIGIRLEESEL